MLFKKGANFWYKMAETRTFFYRKLQGFHMLFKSRDKKRIYWIMNLKKSNLEMKKEYLR